MNEPLKCERCGWTQSPPGGFVLTCPECGGENWQSEEA